MEVNYTASHTFTASAGASGIETAFTVTPGRKLTLKRVTFIYPVGSGFYLHAWIQRGTEHVLPQKGYIVGDGHLIPVNCNIQVEGGHNVVIGYSNTDTSNPHSVCVIFEGVLE